MNKTDYIITLITTAPEVYDYEGTVVKSEPLLFVFHANPSYVIDPANARMWGKTYRRVYLDPREGHRYANYQTMRYLSGAYCTLTDSEFTELIEKYPGLL